MTPWRATTRRAATAALLAAGLLVSARAQVLPLPPRPPDAPGGAALAQALLPLDRAAREARLATEFARGNVPAFLRQLVPLRLANVVAGVTNVATLHVTPDYLAVGSDTDFIYTPLTAATAQRLADLTGCLLPTRQLVRAIHTAAPVRLIPAPLPPGPAMTTLPVFLAHQQSVDRQRRATLADHPPGTLIAGHKKDVVLAATLATNVGKVAIFGWQQPDGHAIQPLYAGHAARWVDYSHGIRFIQAAAEINGQPAALPAALADPALAGLFSDEGPLRATRYPTNLPPATAAADPEPWSEWSAGAFGERDLEYAVEPEITVHLNLPAGFRPAQALEFVCFALPNGNTIAQTMGHALRPGEDWHFNIQHLAAQTRFVRDHRPDRAVVVAYLAADGLSWPAWRRRHADRPERPAELVAQLRALFPNPSAGLTLAAHSGGGAFVFGCLDAPDGPPAAVTRLAFLDANYAYTTERHLGRLTAWLRAASDHELRLLAYDDASALLHGTNFVSAAGGTWGRSHQMLADLAPAFPFHAQTNADFENYSALAGRITFQLRANPGREILHTVQVERNGFIHCLLAGTVAENQDYRYYGPRAYTNWISAAPAP